MFLDNFLLVLRVVLVNFGFHSNSILMWSSLTEGLDYSILDAKNPEDLTEEEKIALLGRPCLGNNTKLQIRIRESKEFKVLYRYIWLFPIWPSDMFRALLTSWWPRLTTAWCKEALPGWNSSLLLSRFRPVSKAWYDDMIVIMIMIMIWYPTQTTILLHLFFLLTLCWLAWRMIISIIL